MSTSAPLEVLAEELGNISGRLERDLRLEARALFAEVREELAAMRTAQAEWRLTLRAVDERIALALDAIPEPQQGPPGQQGETGEPGAEGMLRPAVPWDGGGVYYGGDVVTHRGATWQAAVDTGKEPPHDDWLCLAARGRDGASFSVRSTWAESEPYFGLDVVMRDGASFVARYDNPGPCPGEGWRLMSRQGKAGQPGAKGERGPQGPPGARAVSLTVTAEGLQTLTLDDGSTITCDLYPLLAPLVRG